MGRHADTIARMDRRVQELTAAFRSYVDVFGRANLFTGPSLYFHLKTIHLLRQYSSPVEAIASEQFLESLYATLTAWGMHRMGPGGAKLADLPDLAESLRQQTGAISEVQSLCIWDISVGQVAHVAQHLWGIIRHLRVGVGQTKLIAGSKALHHVLPALVPPMDREYTLTFFYQHKTLNQGDEIAFKEMFPQFVSVAASRRREIEPVLGSGMNTSVTKVLDNAIVGYVLRHIKGQRDDEELTQ